MSSSVNILYLLFKSVFRVKLSWTRRPCSSSHLVKCFIQTFLLSYFALSCVWWPGLLFSAPHLVLCFVGLFFAIELDFTADAADYYVVFDMMTCCYDYNILFETLNENRTYLDRLFREWYDIMIWIDWVFPNLVVCTSDRSYETNDL